MDSIENKEYLEYLEESIKKIKDISSAKIKTTDEGRISEVHVVSQSKRSPEELVQDIESVLIYFMGQVSQEKLNNKE